MSPKALVLIVARELAANLATPIFLIDAGGTLVYFNDAAEQFFGRSFGEVGEISVLEFGAMLDLRAHDGSELARRDTPTAATFNDHQPAHDQVRVRSLDGDDHEIHVTSLPLFGSTDELHGVMTIFWEGR
ncbi:MAG TPA: PAS domain-containing protein [Acidimicrobiales bacterium]|nr:PAS domain-containing protein [Acidimicrobiales bacterium]